MIVAILPKCRMVELAHGQSSGPPGLAVNVISILPLTFSLGRYIVGLEVSFVQSRNAKTDFGRLRKKPYKRISKEKSLCTAAKALH